ncbi:tRNA(Ile)-lysidine synthase [Propionibacterium cyclohexanicum]|uniref:tRNA(Ile)-lysidine synthase n=1 Tax=Propionibacterium cyclohexanicum TaxID=64702 RepID=A0A1H9RV79_9ACTN|nr:tRNA lysidine(34) synthetase TilS [Propionibacterium cyclohexanicum]SER76547.1 tRNA(Ile)-lysidine synthase [Propionibacterium cyclohexanicum]
MSTHALSPACLAIVQALRPVVREATQRGLRVRVGCSGGPDSLALAAGLAHWCRHESALLAGAVVVDHQLQFGSGEVASRTVAVLESLGLAARQVQVRADPDCPGGPEAAARDARYEALRAQGPDGRRPAILLLGHTLDDQAETVLLGLARGSGTRSLAGMAASCGQAPRLVRPLLGLRRSQTWRACADWGLDPWQDPQNGDGRFTRARIRARVMDFLSAELGHDVAPALARTAQLARADADLLDEMAAAELTKVSLPAQGPSGLPRLDCALLEARPAALRGRIVRAWLAGLGEPAPDQERTAAVLRLVLDWHGQKGIDLPGGALVRRAGDSLELDPGSRSPRR